jgi:acyl carrier protein
MIIKDIKELYKIIQPDFLIEMIRNRCFSDTLDLSNAQTWSDIGLDQLDVIEIIMDLEKEYSISIDDDLLDKIDNIGFFDLYSNLTSVKRDTILKELGV